MGLFNHENLQVSCYKDKKTCRFIKGFRKLICSISEIKRTFKGRLYSIHRSEEFCENRTENRKGARAGYKIRTENAPIVVRVF